MGELSSILSSHCQGEVPQWRVGWQVWDGIVTSAVSGVVGDTNWLVMVLAVDCAIGVLKRWERDTTLYL